MRSGRLRQALPLYMVAALSVTCWSGAALAQAANTCGAVQPMLTQRKAISDRLSKSAKGKQIDARVACAGFGQLVSNGVALVKWMDANKGWCQVPDSFVESMKADHERAIAIRAKACSVASKMDKMEKQAREAGGGQGGGLLGGDGLSGPSRLPQGAL